MTVNWERWESLAAVFIAAAEIVSPLIRTEPINMPLNPDTQQTQVMAIRPIHDAPAAKLGALYRENLLETARVNTVTDTYQSVTYRGNVPIGDRPRRREYHTDKFVFSWDPPTV